MHTVFAIDRELRPDETTVYGVISLVFWAVTLVVTLKYVTLVVRAELEGDPDLEHVSSFVSRARIVVTDAPGIARWRKQLFAAIARNAATPVGHFKLPDERTVVMGAHIEL